MSDKDDKMRDLQFEQSFGLVLDEENEGSHHSDEQDDAVNNGHDNNVFDKGGHESEENNGPYIDRENASDPLGGASNPGDQDDSLPDDSLSFGDFDDNDSSQSYDAGDSTAEMDDIEIDFEAVEQTVQKDDENITGNIGDDHIDMNAESDFLPAAPEKRSPFSRFGKKNASVPQAVKNASESDASEGSSGSFSVVLKQPEGTEGQRIGDYLVDRGIITADQLNVALQEKKVSQKLMGEILVELGFIDEDTLSAFLAEKSGASLFDPSKTILDMEAVNLIDKATARKYTVLPISKTENDITVAMVDPYDVVALDVLRKLFPKGLKLETLVATPNVLNEAIDAAYGYASSVGGILKELEESNTENLDLTELTEDEVYGHPLVRLVNMLIFDAVKDGSSDIHFEPEENFIRLRYRKDGVLYTAQTFHKKHWSGISQRLKLMGGLNIADKLAPQDGRINIAINGREVDFRVSSLPTVHGENIVMRVLDKQASIMPLASLGFSEENYARIKKAQTKPEGIIIVTGPTGSGKTTSLYSMLNEINTVDVNIQTLEDPVEYSLPMIRQTPVREGVLEFADGIRALLRQDPDIILIGEIRDKTTATMALQAAMTGHQVYTSLHTNDSFGALPRLIDLGMVPGMIAGNIISIFAQRLGRVLCPSCKQPHTPDDKEKRALGAESDVEIFKPHPDGCQLCEGRGFKGRTAFAEVLLFDEEMDELVAAGASKGEVKKMAVEKGFKSMRDDAILKILDGQTSFEAASKVVDIWK